MALFNKVIRFKTISKLFSTKVKKAEQRAELRTERRNGSRIEFQKPAQKLLITFKTH
jgi:hypothetical protein